MTTYSLSDLLLVWFGGMMLGGILVYLFKRRSQLSKDDARMLRCALSYSTSDFKQNFRNGFPIENDPTLSVRFPTWPAVNAFVKRMMDVLENWR